MKPFPKPLTWPDVGYALWAAWFLALACAAVLLISSQVRIEQTRSASQHTLTAGVK